MSKPEIKISVEIKDDFGKLRDLLYKVEELRELVPDWQKVEADRLHEAILDLGCELITAHAKRSAQNSPSPNDKRDTR